MFRLFRKKKAYLIKWSRDCFVPNEYHETTVFARCEADAVWKFLQGHNPAIEQLIIEKVERYEQAIISE